MCYGWATEQEQAYEVIQYKWYNSQEEETFKWLVTKNSPLSFSFTAKSQNICY